MKLNQRIILITIIPLIVSTSLSVGIIAGITSEQLFDTAISKVKSLCQLAEREMRNPVNNLDIDKLNELVDNLEGEENIQQVLILFPDGRRPADD